MKRLIPLFIILILLFTGCASPAVSDRPAVRTGTASTTERYTLPPLAWDGIDPARTVYVSRNHIVHDSPICSGMKRYSTMTAGEAYAAGYPLCHTCWQIR